MKINIRILSIALALLLLAGSLCACGSNPVNDENTTNTTVESITEDLSMYGTLGKKTWNGRECKILGVYENETSCEIYAADASGTGLESSVFIRNGSIEELFDVEIMQVGDAMSAEKFSTDMLAGDPIYDIAFLYRDDMATAIISQYFYDLTNIEYIDLSQSYYNSNTIESMKISGKLFHMVSDFSLVDKNRIATLFLNRNMAANYDIPSIFDDVRAGTWTYEKFAQYVIQTSNDVDSNDTMDYKIDQFGVTIGSKDESIAFWSAMGAKTVIIDDTGKYAFDYASQYAVSAAEKVKTIFTNKDYYYASMDVDNYEGAGDAFEEGRALFYGSVLSCLPSIAQNAEFVYTVLPYPKYDETQTRYYSNNNNRYCATFGIPTCAADTSYSGFMIEALSMKSTDTTMRQFYEINCKIRNSYDQDCSDMMDVLFDALSFDFGFLYDNVLKTSGNTPKSIVSGSLRDNTRSLTTFYSENGDAQETLLKALLKKINKKK